MTPENASTRPAELHMLGILSDGQSGYIQGMEAAGQRQLVGSTSLPTKANGGDEAYEKLGFTFGKPDPCDPLFRPATLPEGWHKEGSDHAMWSYVVDQLGRRRVAVFYKAAFYDRDAFMRLETVYGYAMTLAYDKALPVFDDAWCTREAFAEAVAEERKHIAERVELYRDSKAAWDPEGLTKAEADLAEHDTWAAKVAEPR